MRHLFRSAALALMLLAGVSFATADRAEARTHFSFSVGVPLGGYYGGPYGGFYGSSFGYYGRGPHWSAAYRGGWPGYAYEPFGYRPYYRPYAYAPSYYAPATYGRPYARPYFGPIVSLGLFPAFVGDTLSYEDRGVYYTAYQRALAAPIGQSIDWNSGRISGAVTTTRDGWAGEKYCREFRQNVTIDGRAEEVFGTACRQPDGDWQLVENQ